MIQRFYQRSFGSRQAGFLVLLAALLLSSTPALEASHDHDAGAGYADCLLCKQASDLPVVSAPGTAAVVASPTYVTALATTPALRRNCTNYSPRGPPALS